MKQRIILAAMVVSLGGIALAQDPYLARWQAVHDRQPEGVSFQISAVKTEFYSGELIPLELSFTSTRTNRFLADTRLQDRVGRMNGVEEFLVDPAAFTEDPLRGLPGETGGMGGLSGGPILLSEKPFSFERLLNDWVRFRKPGKYRIAILSRRITQVTGPTRTDYYLLSHPQQGDRVELVSNILTIDIVPAPLAWLKQQIDAAVRILDTPSDPNSNPSEEMRERRIRAGRMLRFLESPQAAMELARHLGSGEDVDSWSLHVGVLGSPYRKQLLPLLEARMVAPDQPVWPRYLDTLSRLSELVAAGGPMNSFPKNQALEGTWREENRRRDEIRERKRQEYVTRLIAALPAKQPEARVTSMNTLLDTAGRGGADPAWLPALAASLVTDFRSLPSKAQLNLLESRWNVIGGPAMLPVLREIYALPDGDPRLRDIAVRRIYDLVPEEGRRIILAQIARPDPYLSLSTLEMLPDRSLPNLNNALASHLEAHHSDDALILRYATGEIVQRVELAYQARNAEFDRQKLPHCGGALVYYFLRYDPAFGEKELRSDMDKPAAYPACYDIGFQFQSLDQSAYSPALEKLAIEFLMSPKVPVKRGAAEVLGKYGSAAAEKPLWDALEYFRSWWKGREELLDEAGGREGLQFERALRIALAQADSWTLQQDGLNRLLGLCSSNWCKQDVREWLSQATQPISIQVGPASVMIAQYETRSDDQLRRKIGQFPAGTMFRMAPFTAGDKRARAEMLRVEQTVRSAGYSLALQ